MSQDHFSSKHAPSSEETLQALCSSACAAASLWWIPPFLLFFGGSAKSMAIAKWKCYLVNSMMSLSFTNLTMGGWLQKTFGQHWSKQGEYSIYGWMQLVAKTRNGTYDFCSEWFQPKRDVGLINKKAEEKRSTHTHMHAKYVLSKCSTASYTCLTRPCDSNLHAHLIFHQDSLTMFITCYFKISVAFPMWPKLNKHVT